MRDRFGEIQVYVRWQKAAGEQKRFDKAKSLSCFASKDEPAALYLLRCMMGNPEIIPDPEVRLSEGRASDWVPGKLVGRRDSRCTRLLDQERRLHNGYPTGTATTANLCLRLRIYSAVFGSGVSNSEVL